MKTVTVSKEVHALIQAQAIGDLTGCRPSADGTVTFAIGDDTAERLGEWYPNLPLAEAVERLVRGGRLQ